MTVCCTCFSLRFACGAPIIQLGPDHTATNTVCVRASDSVHVSCYAWSLKAMQERVVREQCAVSMHINLSFSDPRQRDSGDVMDRKRKEHIAYEYLCHLEEAKK